MTRRLVVRAPARREMDEASSWYSERGKDLGAEFVDALEEGLAAIEDDPLRYPASTRKSVGFSCADFRTLCSIESSARISWSFLASMDDEIRRAGEAEDEFGG